MSFIITRAQFLDLPAIKAIADACRHEIGFVYRAILERAIDRGELFVAKGEEEVLGFVHFATTRQGYATIYKIAVHPRFRGRGIGKALLQAVIKQTCSAGISRLRLKCPVDLPANGFYAHLGFVRIATEQRRKRLLVVWEKPLFPKSLSPQFFLTLTNHAKAVRDLLALWEEGGDPRDPFANLIVTPLFVRPTTLDFIRKIKEERGSRVFFDSGGYQVQMGRVSYEELFNHLLEVYREHSWADGYVLPDHVPSSADTDREVDIKVRETLDYARLFLSRMPEGFTEKAIGVVHGRTEEHVHQCVEAYVHMGVQYLGFGSFGTSGPKGSVNMISGRSLRLLQVLLTLVRDFNLHVHVFGVGSPGSLLRLKQAGVLPTSFDSAGWWKAGAYGNIFFPGRAQIHLTNLPLNLATWAFVEGEKVRTGHYCPFCKDIGILYSSRHHRILHNLSVMLDVIKELAASGGEQ